MSRSKLFYVFQDCMSCAKVATLAASEKLGAKYEVSQLTLGMPLYTELVLQARDNGVRVPFFTDGVKFSKDAADFKTKRKSNDS